MSHQSDYSLFDIYHLQTKLPEGNVFMGVCLFTGVYPNMHLGGGGDRRGVIIGVGGQRG